MKKEIEYPLGTRPGDGEVLEVAQGVYWVRMPIPFKGLDKDRIDDVRSVNTKKCGGQRFFQFRKTVIM